MNAESCWVLNPLLMNLAPAVRRCLIPTGAASIKKFFCNALIFFSFFLGPPKQKCNHMFCDKKKRKTQISSTGLLCEYCHFFHSGGKNIHPLISFLEQPQRKKTFFDFIFDFMPTFSSIHPVNVIPPLLNWTFVRTTIKPSTIKAAFSSSELTGRHIHILVVLR